MKEMEQRMQTIVSWRMFPFGLGNFWMEGIEMKQTNVEQYNAFQTLN